MSSQIYLEYIQFYSLTFLLLYSTMTSCAKNEFHFQLARPRVIALSHIYLQILNLFGKGTQSFVGQQQRTVDRLIDYFRSFWAIQQKTQCLREWLFQKFDLQWDSHLRWIQSPKTWVRLLETSYCLQGLLLDSNHFSNCFGFLPTQHSRAIL